ncbi:dTDP-4-dehydrorhamnose reductase [Diaminobutyricimonas sp. TR449]|uniref:dTDP-4-dehydrorhamnose reductase n=1 Tax=Diaminobutyricimonas sp. TR449 TaxID=2708076 RepID=UPI0014229510|nr:dTDP-4-dehydrorhamnose reductase [Diaminobutyricimonas sp. TR449]
MTRYLIAGAGGMLGHDLQAVFADRDVTALSRAQLDVTDLRAVRGAATGHDVIINAAAYTRVDDAESDEDAAYAVNAIGAKNLAIAAAENDARLVQLSTDYVFDGTAVTPYGEYTTRHPISAYGRTKGEGERLALEANPARTYIVRTAWLYGQHGPNFAKTMLRLATSQPVITVVTDQVGQPTWTVDLARQIFALVDSDAPAGIYHGTNSGQASWFDFARTIFASVGIDPARVQPTDSGLFARAARRPAYSVLGHDAWGRVGLKPMRPWTEALEEAAASGALVARHDHGNA